MKPGRQLDITGRFNLMCRFNEFLVNLENREDIREHYGICDAFVTSLQESYPGMPINGVYELSEFIQRFMDSVYPEYEGWSGGNHFPVTAGGPRPLDEYTIAGREGRSWDRRTKYGRKRWELVELLIEKSAAIIKNEPKGEYEKLWEI